MHKFFLKQLIFSNFGGPKEAKAKSKATKIIISRAYAEKNARNFYESNHDCVHDRFSVH